MTADFYIDYTLNQLDNRKYLRQTFDAWLWGFGQRTYKQPEPNTNFTPEGIEAHMHERLKEIREDKKRNELPYQKFPYIMVTR